MTFHTTASALVQVGADRCRFATSYSRNGVERAYHLCVHLPKSTVAIVVVVHNPNNKISMILVSKSVDVGIFGNRVQFLVHIESLLGVRELLAARGKVARGMASVKQMYNNNVRNRKEGEKQI